MENENSVLAEVQRRLLDAEDQIRQKESELEQFAYAASHDLQEPLRMVSQYVALIKEEMLPVVEKHGDPEMVAEAQLYMKYAIDGADRMRKMLDGLLAYSRAGRLTETFELVMASDVVQEAVLTLNGAVGQAGATVQVGEMPRIYADRSMLSRVFLNLFTNAIKFRDPKRPLIIDVSAIERDNEVEFLVSDNGQGFDGRFSDRIFTIFQRLRKDIKGTGIGLSVCKKVVERHGGIIWAEATPGEGAVFHFTVRKHRDA